MPITDDGYEKYSWEEIYDRLKSDFEETFNETVEPGDIIHHQLEAEAKTLAENQEEALERVYRAAYLSDAEGKELDKLVSLIGLQRRDAVEASGVVEFITDDPPLATYTVPSSTELQTRGSDPIEFVTTETATIEYIDGFEENLNGWSGDKSSFSINTTSPINGDGSLEVPATSDVEIETDNTYNIGTHFNLDLSPSSGSVKSVKFGIKDNSNYHEVILDTVSDQITLCVVKDDVETASKTTSVTFPTGEVSHLEIQWTLHGDLHVGLYDSSDRETQIAEANLSYTRDWETGSLAIASNDANATMLVDDLCTTLVTANIEAIYGGVEGNVGPDTIRVAPSGLTGIQTVTNPIPTGDASFNDTNLNPLALGQDRENDEELRDRAFENSSIGGAASLSALGTALGNIDGVQSVTVKRNREDSTVDGLPPHSYEPIIYGGSKEEVASVLHQTASIDSTDVGGVHGSEVTYGIESDITGQTETYHWSVPIEKTLNITVDLVVDSTYVGDEDIQSIIANYIGGTDIDGSQVGGLDNGEDVYEAVLKGKLVDPDELGVWEVDSVTIDDNADGTDDTTETSSGADVYAVSDDQVAVTNARDGSITVNTTSK